MKFKVKLKFELLNKAGMVVGSGVSPCEVEYPTQNNQVISARVAGDIKACVLSGVRLKRMDGTHFVSHALPDIFVGVNKRMDFTVGIEMGPQHAEFLSKVPA